MSSNGPSGGFSLFPNTSSTKPPSRKTTPRPRAGSLQSTINQERAPSIEMTPPRNGRRTPDDLSQFIIDGSPPRPAGRAPMASNNPYRREEAGPSVSRPVPASEVPARTDTALSGASTLVRSPSGRSRSSIAKRPLEEIPSSSSLSSPPEAAAAEAGIRSIFPQYDHTLPFDRQEYFPTQTSPSHIPRTVISRQSHVPQQSPPLVRSPVRSPLSTDYPASGAPGQGQGPRWPPRRQHHQEAPVVPRVSTTEELRDYWKAANGWKAAAAEGRGFCLRLTMPEKDTPVYALTSASAQPFYHLRLDPTSAASAYVTLSRHDPAKPCKDPDRSPGGPARSSAGGGFLGALREAEAAAAGAKSAWHEALTTTLEEPARRQAPGDGLVALLYPRAATRMALERPADAAAVAAAERECARLVWDGDSGNYFLVHPALATPFCVTVERSPAWSRTEYTVEHIESAQPLARLTRDGTGEGWMELDTLVAGRVDSYYVLDVAACALLLVAHLDEKNVLVEHFAPPPPPAHLRSSSGSGFSFGLGLDGGGNGDSGRRSSASRLGSRILGGKPKSKSRRGRIEELELDLESQASSLGGKLSIRSGDKEKLPGTMRTVIKLLSFAFKCVIWALTLAFKAVVAVVVGLTKCLTSERL